jgi:hypothetical protein
MQATDQWNGLIVEHEGRIEQHVNSNPIISLDRRSLPTNISAVGISSTTKRASSIAELGNSFRRCASEDPTIILDR